MLSCWRRPARWWTTPRPICGCCFAALTPGFIRATLAITCAPGNRFWPTLHVAGFTPRLLQPDEERELLPLGYGITNLVMRATGTAAELNEAELLAGGRALAEKVAIYRPRVVAVLGIGAYRSAFRRPAAMLGRQDEGLGEARLWVLPNRRSQRTLYSCALAGVYREFLEAMPSIRDFRSSGYNNSQITSVKMG